MLQIVLQIYRQTIYDIIKFYEPYHKERLDGICREL